MTRKEIINGLKMSMDLTLFDPSTGEVMEPWQLNEVNRTAYEAYKGAIELLEEMPSAQPDTTTHGSIPAETGKNDGDRTSGDCISRTQAIDEIHEDADWLASQGSDWQVERMERDKSILMSLPSVQPERKTGRWIPTASGKGRHECSRCHEYAPCYQDGSEHLSTFCVLCGAKMERGEEE